MKDVIGHLYACYGTSQFFMHPGFQLGAIRLRSQAGQRWTHQSTQGQITITITAEDYSLFLVALSQL